MIHLFRADRPGQARGIPELTPAFAAVRDVAAIHAGGDGRRRAGGLAGRGYLHGRPALADPVLYLPSLAAYNRPRLAGCLMEMTVCRPWLSPLDMRCPHRSSFAHSGGWPTFWLGR